MLNEPHSVRESTRETVQNAIEKLHYSPNHLGKNLRQLSTQRILVVLNNISNQFYSRVVRGIEEKAREHHYNVLIFTTRDLADNMQEALDMIHSRVVDGAIFMTTLTTEEEQILAECPSPVVCACEPVKNRALCCAAIDNTKAAFDAVDFLIRSGKQEIAFLSTNYPADKANASSAGLRETGYRRALAQHGIPFDPALVIQEGLTYKAGGRAAKHLLARKHLPDAVFCCSDASAIGLISALAGKGIRTPEDISVVGFDNTAMSEVYLPSLTTVAQPQYEIGTSAMELLLRALSGEKIQNITVPHRLVTRNSVSGRES